MKTYSVTLEEITEHTVQVEANSHIEAEKEAVVGWKEGWYCDDNCWLVRLTPISSSEEEQMPDPKIHIHVLADSRYVLRHSCRHRRRSPRQAPRAHRRNHQ